MPQRICFISKEYLPGSIYGGIPRAVEMEATTLARLGVEVHVLALAPVEEETEQVREGVVVHGLPEPRAALPGDGPEAWDVEYVHQGLWAKRVAGAYAALDARVGFDVVVGADFRGETLHLVRRPETRLVIWLHTVMALVWDQLGLVPQPGERGRAVLELAALERADAVFAPTPLVLEETAALLGDRLPPAHVLPHPFDAERFAAPPLVAHDGPLRLLFSGRLEPRKGPDLAVLALAAARQAGVEAELTLVGLDELGYREAVLDPLAVRLGVHDLRYAGAEDSAGVLRRLAAADAVVLPSRFDNFHFAAVEALAAGRPTLVTDRVGLAAWVAPHDGLLALPAERPDAFAHAAARVLADREALFAAGPRAAARVREALDPATVGARLLAAYDAVQPRRPPSRIAFAAGAAPRREVSAALERFTEEAPYERRTILAFMQQAARELVPGSRVIDVGAGNGPYRELFEHVEYVTTDWAESMHPGARSADIVASAEDLPVHDAAFDAVICTQVLEHVAEPAAVARELRRILRPGGRLYLTVPLAWELHEEPHDYWRYTPSGLRHLLDGAGFETLAITPRNDAFTTLAQLMQNMRYVMGRAPDGRDPEREAAARVLAAMADTVASFAPLDVQRILPLGYSVRAQVPERAPLDGARRFAVVAFADEVEAEPALLRAYADAFAPEDDATLVLYAAGGEEAEVAARLGAALERAGLGTEEGPDMLALVLPAEPSSDRRVAAGADAVLTERPVDGPFAPLARVTRAEVAALRARAGELQAA